MIPAANLNRVWRDCAAGPKELIRSVSLNSNITKSAEIWASLRQWERDRCVLISLENFILREHISPSYAELADLAGITSLAVVSLALRRLQRAGYVKLPPHNKTRSLVVLRPSTHMTAPPAFARRRTAKDLLAEAYDLIGDCAGAADEEYSGHAWLDDYARWRKK